MNDILENNYGPTVWILAITIFSLTIITLYYLTAIIMGFVEENRWLKEDKARINAMDSEDGSIGCGC